jgi:transcriptional regulator with XRE-family HTH domain
MAKKFSELRSKMSPTSRAKARERARAMLADMPLQELRLARGLTQGQLATTLKVRQASISKLERRADMYISTLRSHIQALGGELDIIARFPDGEVRIANFEDVASERRLRGSA